jgi:hypothetical protein
MFRHGWVAGVLAVGLLAAPARAERVPSTKTALPPVPGARVDITVPYLTNGFSNVGFPVAPRIYKSPIVDDTRNPGTKPVFNLIFYGSVMSFGDQSNGATPRPPNMLRPPRP